MTKKIAPLLLATIALLAAACGDDDDASAPDSTQPEGSGPAATEPASTEPAATEPAGTASGATTPPATGDCALDTPLKIGFAADLGELGAFSDQPGSEAAQVQVDLVNEAGGVGGLPVEYVVKDIQGDPAATQRAAQELLDDGVNAIIGPPFANTGTPLLDTVDGQAPIIYMASTDPQLADPSRGAFLASFSDPVQSAAAAEFAIAQGLTTAVTFSSADDLYFLGNPAYFTETFEQAGGTLVQDFSFSLADEDFSSQVNEMAGLDPAPQALYTAMVMPQIATLLQQMDAAGLGDVTVIGADAFDATVVWSAGDVADGVFFAAHTFPTADNDVQAFLDAAVDRGCRDRDDQLRRTRLGFGADPRPRCRNRMLGRSRHADLHDQRDHRPARHHGLGHLRGHERSAREGRRHPHRRRAANRPSTTTMRPTYIPEP